jgi:hypothetical protein
VETQIGLIAAGKADKAAVVEHTLQQFVQKFMFFSENISRMDVLFEANFAPLTASGSPLLRFLSVYALEGHAVLRKSVHAIVVCHCLFFDCLGTRRSLGTWVSFTQSSL